MTDETILPAGRYYVGDLYYVIRDEKWKNVSKWLFESKGKYNLTKNCIKSPEGMVFYILNTGADGEYKDSNGRVYPVDSASIGCVHEKWVDKNEMELYDEPCGHLIDFPKPFTCWVDGQGSFHFGNQVFIDMAEEEENEEEESEAEE
jgi:hypothetical protein